MGWRHGLSEKWQRAKPFLHLHCRVMPDSDVCKFRGDQPDDVALLGRNFKWNISATNTGAGYVDFLEQEYNGRKVNSKPLSILGWATTVAVAVMCLMAFPEG